MKIIETGCIILFSAPLSLFMDRRTQEQILKLTGWENFVLLPKLIFLYF